MAKIDVNSIISEAAVIAPKASLLGVKLATIDYNKNVLELLDDVKEKLIALDGGLDGPNSEDINVLKNIINGYYVAIKADEELVEKDQKTLNKKVSDLKTMIADYKKQHNI